MEFNNFLTIDYVSTFLGTVVVTMLIVQFFKELPYVRKIPTKYFSFIVALLNILICSILTNNLKLSSLYLIFINAILITFTTTGGYDFAFKNVQVKKVRPEKIIEPTGQITEKR